jgi:hypothetical protein
MVTIKNAVCYEYAQTVEKIRNLKTETYKSTEDQKYAYLSPDGKTFRNHRPSEELMSAGWTYTKVKFVRVESHMSPQHSLWRQYRDAKRRATLLLAARMILKNAAETVPQKNEISSLLCIGIFRSQARTSSEQKSLAYAAYRFLRKLDNRVKNQPGRFSKVEEWTRAVPESEVGHV